jgi:invasion protein IalB
MVGGGLRTTLTLVGPLGLGLDSGGHLVIDGVDKTRLALSAGVAVVARW